jgi:hypothetical protein
MILIGKGIRVLTAMIEPPPRNMRRLNVSCIFFSNDGRKVNRNPSKRKGKQPPSRMTII